MRGIKKMLQRLGKKPATRAKVTGKHDFGLDIKAIWLGFTAALGIWLVAALLSLLWLFGMDEGTYSFGIYIYLQGILGVFIGSLLAGSRAEDRGWLHGLWVGVFLGMLGIVVNLELMPQAYTWAGVGRQLLVWSLWGLTGGYIGYYLKPGIRKKQAKKRIPGSDS